jgi:hypothetical protein
MLGRFAPKEKLAKTKKVIKFFIFNMPLTFHFMNRSGKIEGAQDHRFPI